MDKKIFEGKIKKTAEKIGKEFKPEKVILFGSWAWGKPTKDSDVDFLVVKKTKNARDFARKIDGFIFPRPFPLDLIVFSQEQIEARKEAGDLFFNDIISKGKLLYGR